MAAQLTLMNGMLRCALRLCTARATSSLPVPVSPVINTVLRVAETNSMRRITSAMSAALADDAVSMKVFADHCRGKRADPTAVYDFHEFSFSPTEYWPAPAVANAVSSARAVA